MARIKYQEAAGLEVKRGKADSIFKKAKGTTWPQWIMLHNEGRRKA